MDGVLSEFDHDSKLFSGLKWPRGHQVVQHFHETLCSMLKVLAMLC